MNKKLIFGVAILGLSVVLSACSTTSSLITTKNGGANRRPDYGQPTTQPEIRGIVKLVIGNEVTVLKIDRPQGAQGGATTTATSTNSDNQTPTLSLGGTTGTRQGGGGFTGGSRPQGAGGSGGGFTGGGSGNTATDRTAMLERLKAMSTGEEKVIIPVGIKMLKSDPSNTTKQRIKIEATISDITADKNLTIWLDASITDKKVASFVMIN